VSNLTISNKLKGILQMEYDQDKKTINVVENVWKRTVEKFSDGAFVPKKFAK